MSDQQDINIFSSNLRMEDVASMRNQADQLKRITETLAGGGEFNIRATGKELAPFILPGDLLVFVSTNFVKMGEGDFLLYRSNAGIPAVRRVIRKSFLDNQALAIMRAEQNHDDRETIRAGQILARLTHIERHGQKIKAWRLNRGIIDWLTRYGTRHPLSRLEDLLLNLLPIRKRTERRAAIRDGLIKVDPAEAKKKGKTKDPFTKF